jgi:hypothetical protein
MDDIIPLPQSMVPNGFNDSWIVLEDPDQVALYRREWRDDFRPSRIVCWADLPAKAGKIAHLIVYFQGNSDSGCRKAERLEHDLRFLKNLKTLDIPNSFVSTLDPNMLPASLRRITVSTFGRVSFPKGRVFPGIQVLDAFDNSHSQVKFEPETFPDLREVSCRLDANKILLDVISTYPSLSSLMTGPVKDGSFFQRLGSFEIDFLHLVGGWLPSLDGIQSVRGMRFLKVSSFKRLVDITALEHCQDLEVLEIFWCSKLVDYQPLLRIPRLKSLFLFANRSMGSKGCSLAFRSKPEVKLRIWNQSRE